MNQFASLESQVLKAQDAVDVLGFADWGDSLLVAIQSQGLLHRKPQPDVTRREIVAMPDAWLKELAEFPEASEMGLAYLARFAQRHGFISIHAATRWLDIERSARSYPGYRTAGHLSASGASELSGLQQLLKRTEQEPAARDGSLGGIVKDLFVRSTFEISEALDMWRRTERRRRK